MSRSPTVVLTGATGSLGGATARHLAAAGARLFLVGRSAERLEAVAGPLRAAGASVDVIEADLADLTKLRSAAEDIRHRSPEGIDALVHTAAVFRNRRVLKGKYEEMVLINHLAPLVLTAALLEAVKARRGRVVTVTAPSSSTVNLDDLMGERRFSALSAFGATKAMNLLFTAELARRLAGTGATADAFHPGLVKSTLLGELPWLVRTLANVVSAPPDRAGRALAELALAPGVDGKGRLMTVGKELPFPGPAASQETQRRLWAVSEAVVG